MIKVKNFSKSYEGQEAVNSLSFAVEAGEILGLIGPNGAGKTTTLRTLAGILQPSSGVLSIAGYDLAAKPIEAKRQLAFVPDIPRLFDSLTIREHLELTARIYRLDNWQERAERLLAEFEIDAVAGKTASQLSLGMSQKAMMCCALLHQPQALLLDEPLTGLDPRGIRTLLGALRTSAENGAAVILSTHLLGQIGDFCDRLLIVKEGRCLLEGTMAEIQAVLPASKKNASLEEIFFHTTEAGYSQ
jgi:ABC-2 type transport system ATP-binding protein